MRLHDLGQLHATTLLPARGSHARRSAWLGHADPGCEVAHLPTWPTRARHRRGLRTWGR